MNTLAQQLTTLAHRVADQPWPTTEAERRSWAERVGLPSHGEELTHDEPQSDARFSAPSHGGRAYWSFHQAQFTQLSLIIATVDKSAAETFHTAARELQTALNNRWNPSDHRDNATGFLTEWQPSGIDIDLYWSGPNPDDERPDCALHLAFSDPQRDRAADAAQRERHHHTN